MPRAIRSQALLFLVFPLLLFSFSLIFEQAFAATTDPACTTSLGPWQLATPVPRNHLEGATAQVNNKLYLIGGFSTVDTLFSTDAVDVYDPVTDTWQALAPLPIDISHMQAAVDGTNIWVAGGFHGKHPGVPITDVTYYDILTDTWHPGPPLPAPRASGALVRLGRDLHYFGGLSSNRQTDYPQHWVLDLDNPVQWTTAAPLPRARNHLQGVVVDGAIFAMGGQHDHDDPNRLEDLPYIHVYHPDVNRWDELPPLPLPRSHSEPGTFVFNDRIIMAGGRNNEYSMGPVDTIIEYNPQTQTTVNLRNMPIPILAPYSNIVQNYNGVPGTYLIITNGAQGNNVNQFNTWVSEVTTNCVVDSTSPTLTPPPIPIPSATPVQSSSEAVTVSNPAPNIEYFDPSMSKLGFLRPGELGVTGEQLEWVVTVSNNGTGTGNNIVITDTLRPELRINSVNTPVGGATINGQTVSVTIPSLAPGQVVSFSIFTTVLKGQIVDNTACLNAPGVDELCVTGQAVTALPHTGETPLWRYTLLAIAPLSGMGLYLMRARRVRRHN